MKDSVGASILSERQGKGRSVEQIYERLAFELDDGDGGNSLSGYQCINPFVDDLVAAVRLRSEGLDWQRYTYLDGDQDLVSQIRAYHAAVDGVAPSAIVCGSGASSQLFGFVTYLHAKGVRKVFYVPPLYFTLYVALERYGIAAVPVADRQPYERNFRLRLPEIEDCCLLLADPVWYAGMPVADEVMEAIGSWQRKTRSLVFVDGSLQYMRWRGVMVEASSRLSRSLTIRLICPTKQLAIHGYRFSYLLVPELEARSVAWACANVAGAASAESLAFGHEAMEALNAGAIPRRLMGLVSARHRYLRESGKIDSVLNPECGYFVFERLNSSLSEGHVLADGKYFEQDRYPGYCKINLLSPSIGLICGRITDAGGPSL